MRQNLSTGNQIAFDDHCLGDEWRTNWLWRPGKSPFGAHSRHTYPVVGKHERQPVRHVGVVRGLSRLMRRRMSANRSREMATSAIWKMT